MRHRAAANLCGLLVLLGATAPLGAQAREESDELRAARKGLAQARSVHADASAAVSKATVTRMRLERSVELEYLNRPDLADLKRYAGAVAIYYNALRNAVLEEIHDDPDYHRLKQAERDAAAALAAAKQDPQLTLADEMPLAHALMNARKAISQFEASAMAMDPEIEATRVEMNRAYDAARKLELNLRRLALRDVRLASAEAEVRHAQARLVTARAELSKAAQRLAKAEARESRRNTGRRADPPPIQRPEK